MLAKVCKDHHAELASTLLHIFSTYDRLLPLINAYLAKSVDNEGVFVSMCYASCVCMFVFMYEWGEFLVEPSLYFWPFVALYQKVFYAGNLILRP